jgi:hypothetical protein
MLNVTKEVAAMQRMTVDQLRAKYAEVFREETRSRHKEYLIKRIAWRMQANEEGGLSERALKRAMELANDADLRVVAPRTMKAAPADIATRTTPVAGKVRSKTTLMPGSALKREYKGQTIHVKVLADGFEYEAERFKSLTAVAKFVTGTHWSGHHFFGLRQKGGGQ